MFKVPGEVGSRVDLGKGEAMGLEGSKMALGAIVNWSLPRAAGMGCHTGQEGAASPLTQQGGQSWVKGSGQEGGRSPVDFRVRSQHGNPRGRERSPRA